MAFTYAPLEGNNAFRLLRLLGGEGDVVECELFHANSDCSKLRYEAVSYCWGSKQRQSAIRIDGKTLMVRESLVELLKHLRHPNPQKHRTIWIDAICIDQRNTGERGHQVQQMRRIYASARRVIFWLGELTPDVRLLMIALDAFNRAAKAVGWNLLKDEVIEQSVWYEAVITMNKNSFVLNAHGRMREGLRHLLKRPWFSRAWIIQEVANARRGIIQCGQMVIACRPFTLAPKLLGMEANTHCRNVLDAMPTRLRNTSWWSDDRDLFGIIQKFRYSESTLDRDRIYALRGLCTFRDEKTFLGVDYKQSIQHVINDAISHMCMCDRHALPDSLYSSMGAFLNDLESMHLRVLIALLKSEDIDGVRNILTRHSTSIKISPLMLNHAVTGVLHAPAITKSLLKLNKERIQESIVLAACKNEAHGPALISLLLNFGHGQIEISESAILAACENKAHGSDILHLLLSYAQNASASPSLFIAAVRNPAQEVPLTTALLQFFHPSDAVMTPELRYAILVNEKARRDRIVVLFQQQALGVEVDEDIAVAAARNWDDLFRLHDFFESGLLTVTEKIFLAAADNAVFVLELVKYLTQWSTAEYLEVPERLFVGLINSSNGSLFTNSYMALCLLLEKSKEGISISDQVLLAILRHQKCIDILEMVRKKQGSLHVSQAKTSTAGAWDELPTPEKHSASDLAMGHPALWWAIENTQGALLAKLIEKGVDLSVHRRTAKPLHNCIGDLGTRYRVGFLRESPLGLASRLGNLSIIKILLDGSADINFSASALLAAMGSAQTFQFLIEHGAQASGELLIAASYLGHVSIVDFALHSGTKDDIECALKHAVVCYHIPVVRLLLKAGARVDVLIPPDFLDDTDYDFGRDRTLLHWALSEECPNMDLVELLLQSGAEINEEIDLGETSLCRVARRQNWKLYERLLEAGADESIVPEELRKKRPDLWRTSTNFIRNAD